MRINLSYLDQADRLLKKPFPLIDLFKTGGAEIPHLAEICNVGVMHRKGIQILKGQPKQGKSTAAMAFVMAMLRGEYADIRACEDKLKVLWIDTEQGEDEVRMRFQRALKKIDMYSADVVRGRVMVSSLKCSPVQTRADLVCEAIDELRPDFVVLDGLADLVLDFNKPDECTALMEKLGAAVEKTQIALLAIVHENRQDGHAKGHAGAIAEQKAYEIYGVKKDDTGGVKVEYENGRGKNVPPFSLRFGEGGVPEVETEPVSVKRLAKWLEVVNAELSDKEVYRTGELEQAYERHFGLKKGSGKQAHVLAKQCGVFVSANGNGVSPWKFAESELLHVATQASSAEEGEHRKAGQPTTMVTCEAKMDGADIEAAYAEAKQAWDEAQTMPESEWKEAIRQKFVKAEAEMAEEENRRFFE